MSDDLSCKILDYFCERAEDESVTMDTPLKDSFLIDSIKNLDLVLFLEEEFGIAVTRRDILHHFETPSSIVALVQSRQNGK